MGNGLVKLARGIRQRNGESQHLLSPPIFKLNGHCFDELFEYLSLRDLHSLGQTCKSMQRMTGEFFTRNYSGTEFNCLRDGIYLIDSDDIYTVAIDECIPIPGFMQFITWLSIGNNIAARHKNVDRFSIKTNYHCDMGKFKYIKLHAHELKSVRKLTLTMVSINKQTVRYIRKILPNIEVLELMGCTFCQDLYDVLLKYCENVRRIQLGFLNLENNYKWLRQHYEKLEHLGLILVIPRPNLRNRRWLQRKYTELERLVERLGSVVEDESDNNNGIAELCTFFELNPNVRSFSCSKSTFLYIKDALLNSKVKLDTFELRGFSFEDKSLWDLLFQLRTQGFYKRFHASGLNDYFDEDAFYHGRPTMPFLERLSLCKAVAPFASHLIEYANSDAWVSYGWNITLEDGECAKTENTKNEILAEDLINVERLYLFRKFSLDMPLFILQLKNLRKLKLVQFESAEILELDVLNRAREKLAGAQKVTIYVPDDVYLATKWATKNGTTNFSLIEMKRTHSYEWGRRISGYLPTYMLPPGMF